MMKERSATPLRPAIHRLAGPSSVRFVASMCAEEKVMVPPGPNLLAQFLVQPLNCCSARSRSALHRL